jgi:hypothetical protein
MVDFVLRHMVYWAVLVNGQLRAPRQLPTSLKLLLRLTSSDARQQQTESAKAEKKNCLAVHTRS